MSIDRSTLERGGIDFDEFLDRVLNNEAIARQVLSVFMSDGTLDELRGAVEREDVSSARQAAHKLKGMGGSLSAHAIAELAQAELDALHASDLDRAAEVCRELELSCARLKEAISQAL